MLNRTLRSKPSSALALSLSLSLISLLFQTSASARVASDGQLSLKGDASAIRMVANGSLTAVSALATDVDDDGASDVVVGLSGAEGHAILVVRGNASLVYPFLGTMHDGLPLDPTALVRSVAVEPKNIVARDVDADGRVDLVASAGGDEASVAIGADDPTLETVSVAVPVSKSGGDPLVVTGRFNADAIPDTISVDRTTLVATAMLSKQLATFTVTSTADAGAGSLRQAILDANASSGADAIDFNIATASKTIVLATPLPFIAETVSIDASTQPLYAGVPLIELSGGTSGSTADGLVVQAASTLIRGLAVNGFGSRGIVVQSATCIVEGNHIGTDLAGNAAKANGAAGISVETSGPSLVGGTSASAMNVVSGNAGAGVVVVGSGAAGNIISGNRIGTNRAGTGALPNTTNGIALFAGANSTVIGGSTLASRNVISGNTLHGVFVGDTVSGVLVENNAIGTGPDGTGSIGNLVDGVHFAGFNSDVVRNRIANNAGDGVIVELTGTGVTIGENSIASNGNLGIDLTGDGVTANDLTDADTGANDLQNFPILTSASSVGGSTTIAFTLNSEPSSTYRVDFYSSASCDTTGNGEGDTFLGFSTVTTDALGTVTASATLTATVTSTEAITATATDSEGDTSEFSACTSAATSADLSVDIVGAPNPVTPGANIVYTITIGNSGPLPAADVQFLGSVPSGTVFTSAATTQGTLTTPTPGGVGAISANIGTIADDATATITMIVEVVGPPSLTITNTAFVSSSTPDPSTVNNTDTASNAVIDPPVITSISKVPSSPFRIRILGANFKAGVTVFIASDASPWPSVKMKDSSSLTLKKGGTLKARFPKGVPVAIRVVNTDGGEATMTYTR